MNQVPAAEGAGHVAASTASVDAAVVAGLAPVDRVLGRGGGPGPAWVTDDNAQSAQDLATIFRAHHGALVRLAMFLVHDLPTAEDIIQDVFARIQARPKASFEPGGELAYLRVCVINGCRSVHRRRALVRRAGVGRGVLDQETAYASAEAEVIKAEERRRVLAALAALPARRREVLVLRYYLGLSESQIAQTLGISQGTVKSTAARAIAALARQLGEES
jgi:RNA polymerase sigma factor (sigma-70 family)